MAGNKPGKDSMLASKEFVAGLKALVFQGKTLKEIADISGISESSIYHWHADNVAGIRDKMEVWRLESKLAKADRNIDGILDLPYTEKEYVKVVADMSKFVKETLDKENYSKRQEMTGKDGEALVVDSKTKETVTEALNEYFAKKDS